MRKPRDAFQLPESQKTHLLLCHSALSGVCPPFTKSELLKMRDHLLELAEFASTPVLAFCFRPTSFQLLLEQPAEVKVSKRELIARIENSMIPLVAAEIVEGLKKNDPRYEQRALEHMGSINRLLQRLKHAASVNFHKQRGTKGVIWETRYLSTIVEPGHAARCVAAWIDHGGLRDGQAKDPTRDRCCTVGHAVAGNITAQKALARIFAEGEAKQPTWKNVLGAWKHFCQSEPEEPMKAHGKSKPLFGRAELLRREVSHFTHGLAVGSEAFIEELFLHNRSYFKGREEGPRRIRGQNDPLLFNFRDKGDLRKM